MPGILQKNRTINFKITIPSNLEHCEYLYITSEVYYTKTTEIGTENQNSINEIGLTTGDGVILEINQNVAVGDGVTVNKNEKIRYEITIQNKGKIDAKEVIVQTPIPAWSSYVQENIIQNSTNSMIEEKYYSSINTLQWNIEEIKAGEEQKLEFYLKANKIPTILEYYSSNPNFIKENEVVLINLKIKAKDLKIGINNKESTIKTYIQANNINLKEISQKIYNIDMGLIVKKKIDLKIENTISKVTLNTKNGNKEYIFDNVSLAKVEVKSKELAGAMVLIEYTIKVTNVGDLPENASSIMVYKNQLQFNSGINTVWYQGTDGNYYTSSLERITINPGETKEIKILLIKNLNSNNTGNIETKVAIDKTYNDKNLEDNDKQNNENKAECIIMVATGEKVINIVIILAGLIILIVIIILVKKKEP